MIETLTAAGYKTQVQTLAHFYDDYGLAKDGDDEEEDDDEDDEDDEMEDGSESGSDEDTD